MTDPIEADPVRAHNRSAWDAAGSTGYDRYATPVSPEEIAAARRGELRLGLTDATPVPRDWLPADLSGVEVLALASGGGQQAPLLAAAGARVTSFDNSPGQLARDRLVAEREGLTLRTVEGDMRDLSAFADESFDLIFNPVSTCFVAEVLPVWRECARVLRPGGTLLAGFMNPDTFAFDLDHLDATGEIRIGTPRPYREDVLLSPEEQRARREQGIPLHFGHSFQELFGGQLDAGLVIIGFYEDTFARDEPLDRYLPSMFATRALKPARPLF